MQSWCIAPNLSKEVSSFYMLGLTESRLPQDAFSFFPIWKEDEREFSFVTRIQGTRYNKGVRDLAYQKFHGNDISLSIEPDNFYGEDACCIQYGGRKLGYINHVVKNQVVHWIQKGRKVELSIVRRNGRPEEPTLFAGIRVS